MFRTKFFIILALALLASCPGNKTSNALLYESIRWYTGENGAVDDARARVLLELAVETGDPLAVMWLARVYSTGRMTFVADKNKAITIAESVIFEIEEMAQRGHPEAMFLLGTAFAEGLAKPESPEHAASWYRQAAHKGNTLAMHNMGNVYASGTGVPQSDRQAVSWWRQAAEAGDAIPQLRLGTMLEQGRGVEQDLNQAVAWYLKAANRGNQAAAEALERLEISY